MLSLNDLKGMIPLWLPTFAFNKFDLVEILKYEQ